MTKPFYTFYKKRGKSILLREKQEDGKTKTLKINNFSPRLWIESDQKTDYKHIFGQYVEPLQFTDMNEANNHIKQYEGIEGYELYGTKNFPLDYVCQTYGKPEYDATKIRALTIDIEVKSPDEFPKPEEARHPIDCLNIHDNIKDTYYLFSLYDFDTSDKRLEGLKVLHRKFANEIELLQAFVHFWYQLDPDVYTGWNTKGFDTPYLHNRIEKLLGEDFVKKLSPFGLIYTKEKLDDHFNKQTEYEFVGVSDLDYIQLYKKHTFETRESYTLDYIGMIEGVGRKTEYEDDSLYDLSERDPQTYQVYNIQDSNIVVELDRKLKLLDVTYALSYMSLSNYVDTLGTTKQWENFVYSYLMLNKNTFPNVYKQNTNFREFPGAFVKEPRPGKYGWLASFDFASLYPHVVMQQNLGPETIIHTSQVIEALNSIPEYKEYANNQFLKDLSFVTMDNIINKNIPEKLLECLKELNLCLSPNGSMYRRDKQSFFNEMMNFVYKGRKKVKGEMKDKEREYEKQIDKVVKDCLNKDISALDALQMAFKILMNSGYGAITNEYFHYFLIDVGEAITTTGQVAVQWVTNDVNKHLRQMFDDKEDRLLYCDTDSGYFHLQSVVDRYLEKKPNATKEDIVDMLDKFCEKVIDPIIKKSCDELAEYLNSYEQRLDMKREVIAESGIWQKKKRYVLAKWDDEGVRYSEPKIKITGVEAVRSTTPSWAKDYLKKLYKVCLLGTEEEVHKLYKEFEEDFKNMKIENIAIPTGVNHINKYSDQDGYHTKGAQAHIRAAINYNRVIKEKDLKRLAPIKDGEKIKYLLLKPNPLQVDVIAFKGKIPEAFEIESYVDKRKTFKKGFEEPANALLKLFGWNLEKKATLEGLF